MRLRRLDVGGVGQGEIYLRVTAPTKRGGKDSEGEGGWRELKFVIGVDETLQWDGNLATLVVAQQ